VHMRRLCSFFSLAPILSDRDALAQPQTRDGNGGVDVPFVSRLRYCLRC
jgi:hypothetical protein